MKRKLVVSEEPDEVLTDAEEDALLKDILGTEEESGLPAGPLIFEILKERESKKEKTEMAAVAVKTVKEKTQMTPWEEFDLAVKHLRIVYLWGPPGIAKTHHSIDLLGKHLKKCGLKGQPTVTTLNEDIVVQEIKGHYLPTEGGGMKFHLGPASMALMEGALIVNELPRASGAVLDFFLEIMDGEHVAHISMPDNSTIIPHKDFKMVVTANEPETSLDPALQDRLQVVIQVTEPHPDTVLALNKGYKGLGDIIRESYKSVSRAISVRGGFTFVELIKQKVDKEVAGKMAFQERWEDISTTLKLEAV